MKARQKNNPSEEEVGDKKGSRNVTCARERWVQVKDLFKVKGNGEAAGTENKVMLG